MKKSWLISSSTLFISLAISILLCELVLRFWSKDLLGESLLTYSQVRDRSGYVVNGVEYRTVPLWERDDYYAFSLRKNQNLEIYDKYGEITFTAKTNNFGFRYDPSELTQSKVRVMVLGDSLIFGHGVNDDQTLPANLNNLKKDPALFFINYGVGAWSFGEYYLTFKRFLTSIEPSLVIICIYTGNDFHELERTDWAKRETGELPTPVLKRYDYGFDSEGNLVSESLAYKFPLLRESLFWIALDKFVFNKFRITAHNIRARKGTLSTLQLSLKILEEISRKNPTVAVVIPPYFEAPDPKFMEGLNQIKGIRFLNGQPLVESFRSEVHRYYLYDGVHFTPEGNQLVAEYVFNFIVDEKLVSKGAGAQKIQ